MFELIQVGERTFYIDCPSKIGICLSDGGVVCLVDSGIGEESGRRALEIITGRGWTLGMIINTHSHADHMGGNKFLQEAAGCPAYAAGTDAAVISNSVLNTAILYGGNPPDWMSGRLLYAPPSNVRELDGSVLPDGVTVRRLDGHSFAMIGVRSADGVWFLADALMNEATLDKYHIPFILDYKKHFETLSSLETLEGELFIPSHFPPIENPKALAAANREKIIEIAEKLLKICETPASFDDIIKKLFDSYGLKTEVNQYMLGGCSIRSMLSYLCRDGRIGHSFADNRLLWKSS
ncbi:MAG: MBL fold metallo-hydrolase [Synergistaceae bacterium]|jgi:glyoxylase-like metal-dependent hydrolase (beta-lactamase superfamily II)|nr:MBL fold metallo-hydrolase [Synergistaceae bacterium]